MSSGHVGEVRVRGSLVEGGDLLVGGLGRVRGGQVGGGGRSQGGGGPRSEVLLSWRLVC